jgi:hypothetical protein
VHLTCPNCTRQLSIADDKITPGKRFKLVCPQCKKPFTFQQDDPAPEPTSLPAPDMMPVANSEAEPDVFPPGARIAYVFVQDEAWNNALSDVLRQLDYHTVFPDDARIALEKIDMAAYDLIIIDDHPPATPVLAAINAWPGTKRSLSNLILITSQAKSLHPGASFQFGVNSHFHRDDHHNAQELIQTAIAGYEETYKTLRMAKQALE